MLVDTAVEKRTSCYHCGEHCNAQVIKVNGKLFCCEGCKMVYELLNNTGMCEYYALNNMPGISQRKKSNPAKFAFLDDDKMMRHLISYRDDSQTRVTFYLPQVHCSSCLWLLENLRLINGAVVRSEMNFPHKQVSIVFEHHQISLRELAEMLTSIGYEPYISLQATGETQAPFNRGMVIRLGVAAFCFANIMLLSFPEYLGLPNGDALQPVFRFINLVLSLPVFFYCTQPFFSTAMNGLKHRFLHIDLPVSFAIVITFLRSIYEVTTGQGSGYFDSMSGIVFFMLAGRVLQDRTQQQLSFTRDYQDYFPLAATVIKEEKEVPVMLPDIKCGDTLRIHNEELIPADGILTRGRAFIDYSFVTGEFAPQMREMGEIIYAGGKQTGSHIEMLVIKEVAQSYLTSLWNQQDLTKDDQGGKGSFVHTISAWFAFVVFVLAFMAGVYWKINDPIRMWNAVTAVLIVACPCALLLTGHFSNGNILRILSRNKLYLRNAVIIEQIARIDHIVFDKTGTLTSLTDEHITYCGEPLPDRALALVHALANQSVHPLSKALSHHLGSFDHRCDVREYSEDIGYGISAVVNGELLKIGSLSFVEGSNDVTPTGTRVYISISNKVQGYFAFNGQYRKGIRPLMRQLSKLFHLSVISGDNNAEIKRLEKITYNNATLLFNRKPADKLNYIQQLRQTGAEVMMVGDGLNDAGALAKSNVGIAVTERFNNFTPASDAIMDAAQLPRLFAFIRLCRLNKTVVICTFLFSILYNLVGIVFALSGTLSPVIAAILMPASSLSILLITYGATSLIARWLKL